MDPDRRFAADTVSAIGLIAQRLPETAETCLDGLFKLTRQGLFPSPCLVARLLIIYLIIYPLI